jgi:N-glycosidase YbiA
MNHNNRIREVNDRNKETEDKIFFYTPYFYAFDNFSAHAIEIWGKLFLTSEHAYQWKKYEKSAPDLAEKIFASRSASEVKLISDSNKDKVDPNFHKKKLAVMEEIIRAKAQQHPRVVEKLMMTQEKEIIENSPYDDFWGIGPDGNGQNHLGKLWMKLRDELRASLQ